MGTIKTFVLAAIFVAVFVFYFNDKETGILIAGCALLVVCFCLLPNTETKLKKNKASGEPSSDN
jgi:hypothetical protein